MKRREFYIPGQAVQVDVKHSRLNQVGSNQFTAIDEATR